MTETAPSSSPGARGSLLFRFVFSLGKALERDVWIWVFFAAALLVRLHWNLEIHPGGDYIYSDMRGYMDRADGIFEDRWGKREYNGFYPYGTHVLLYAIQAVFGRGEHAAISAVYAVLGAVLVAYAFVLARRVSGNRIVPIAVGALLVFYYPLISLGGYFLSEVPFSLCLTAATVHLLRMIQDGRRLDAWLSGIFVALGFTLRPQIMLSVALVGVAWLLLRRSMPRARLSLWLRALVPVLAIVTFSAWRLHHHTGRYGLISENGSFNRVFGRCHARKITALPDRPPRRRTSFGPPPLIQLDHRARRAPGQWPQLEAADQLEYEYRGYIGDAQIHDQIIERCVQRSGLVKQLEYAAVHVFLLWRYNVMWPDSGKRMWQGTARRWGNFTANVVAVPALLALLSLLRPRRFLALALISLHLVALIVVAAVYLGGARFRAPYDPILIVMAFEVYAIAAGLLLEGVRRLRARRRETERRSSGSEDEAAKVPASGE